LDSEAYVVSSRCTIGFDRISNQTPKIYLFSDYFTVILHYHPRSPMSRLILAHDTIFSHPHLNVSPSQKNSETTLVTGPRSIFLFDSSIWRLSYREAESILTVTSEYNTLRNNHCTHTSFGSSSPIINVRIGIVYPVQ
jgi:hypothetical protein